MAVDNEPLVKVISEKCDLSQCAKECISSCPVNKRSQDLAIQIIKGKAVIDQENCSHCEICAEECPLEAIEVIKDEVMVEVSQKSRNSQKLNTSTSEKINIKEWKKKPYVLDEGIYQPFRRDKNIFSRVMNDPDFKDYMVGIQANINKITSKNKKGYSVIDNALATAGWTVHDSFIGAFSWGALKVSPEQKFDAELDKQETKKVVLDAKEMAKIIKKAAKAYGGSLVGIAELNRNWVYSHNRKGEPIDIPEEINNTIVIAIEMDLEALQTSPSLVSTFATANGYSKMAFTASCLAEFIRKLGYKAIASGNDTALSVPMAIDAGLGQYGRHGLLITPKFGSNVRICKVLTDMPLERDEPINMGVLEFCRTCKRCAENCPSQSISYDKDPSWSGSSISNNPGVLKWYVNVETCYHFWTENGGDCNNCIVSCPFTKNRHWSHGIARFLIKYLPFLNRLWVKIDHWMGYGKQRDPDEFYEDKKDFIHTR
ncbi:MAG: reductive dehalogenase [Candidatus Kariarchaeaceae archaeon]